MGAMGASRAAARPPRGVRTPQQARSRRTREGILEAAVAAFEDGGFDETTTAAIARRAGIGVGTLYGYFADKRAILLELLDGTVRAIADHVVDGLAPERWRTGDPREHIRSLVEAVCAARNISPGIQRILWERYFKDADFRAAVLQIEQRVRAALEALLRGYDGAAPLRDVDPEAASFVIHTAVEWTASRLVLGDHAVDTAAAVEATAEMVWRFLFAGPAAQAPSSSGTPNRSA
jgi:AcrR family transcriptional regulator